MGNRGDNSGNGGSTGGGVGPAGRKTDGTYGTAKDAQKASTRNDFRNRGAEKIKKGVKTPSLILNVGTKILSQPLQAGSRATRDFYTDKVLGSKNFKNQTKEEFLNMSVDDQEKQFKEYIDKRNSGITDAYGNPISETTLGRREQKSLEQPKVASQMDNTGVKSDMIIADKTAPTSAEMTDDEYSLNTKKKGRKKTIMTSVTGDTEEATLGKKTLLGG